MSDKEKELETNPSTGKKVVLATVLTGFGVAALVLSFLVGSAYEKTGEIMLPTPVDIVSEITGSDYGNWDSKIFYLNEYNSSKEDYRPQYGLETFSVYTNYNVVVQEKNSITVERNLLLISSWVDDYLEKHPDADTVELQKYVKQRITLLGDDETDLNGIRVEKILSTYRLTHYSNGMYYDPITKSIGTVYSAISETYYVNDEPHYPVREKAVIDALIENGVK